jgi:hypothetical protein
MAKTTSERPAGASAKPPASAAPRSNGAATPAGMPLKFDISKLTSSYANFCNANSTREEVVLNFGVNKNWDRGVAGAPDIELNHRIMLSPFAAKRLSALLQQLIKEYEGRYGALSE